MSELNPNNSRIGYTYRSALGLRLLKVGAVVKNDSGDVYRVSSTYFVKTGPDQWMMCDFAGNVFEPDPDDPFRGPFRSEQIYLPATLQQVGVGVPEGPWTAKKRSR